MPIKFLNDVAVDSSVLYVDTVNDRVGIGTASPSQKLDVNGNIELAQYGYIYFGSNTSDQLTINNSLSGSQIIQRGSSYLELQSFNGSGIKFNVGGFLGTDVMVVTSSANVGIGTTSPSQKLHVVGNTKIEGVVIVNSSNDSLYIGSSNTGQSSTSTGDRNVVIGPSAFRSNTSAKYNTAVGHAAMQDTTTGNYNSVLGNQALRDNIDGDFNVAVGNQTMAFTTNSSNNTAVGYRALYQAQSGSNTAIGQGAFNSLQSSTSSGGNTGIGQEVLNKITSGRRNVGVGHAAGQKYGGGNNNVVTANDSVFIGADSDAGGDNQTNQIVIGYNAIGLGSNTAVLGNNSIVTTQLKGNVGIGTTSPAVKLHVGSTSTSGTTTEEFRLQSGTSSGNGGTAIANLVTGSFGTSGIYFGNSSTYTSQDAYLKYADSNNATTLHFSSSLNLEQGTSGSRMYINSSGNVGIGTTSPSRKLQVIGTDGVAKFYYNSSFTNAQYSVVDIGMMTSGTAANGFGPKITFRMGGNGYDGYTAGSIGTIRNGADNTHNLNFATSNGGSMTTKMTITNTGNVGIGTTSPAYLLDVNEDDNVLAFRVTGGGGGAPIASFVRDVGATGSSVNINAQSNFPQIQFTNTSNTFSIGGDTSGNFKISDNTAIGTNDRITINNTGNVGIGTTSPAAKLEVNGTSLLRGLVNITTSGEMLRLNDTNSSGNPYMSFYQNGARRSFIQHNDSSDYLKLASEYGGISFFTGTGGTSTQKMTILSGGNVGIGTTNPATKLEINGPSHDANFTSGCLMIQQLPQGDRMFIDGNDIDCADGTLFLNDYSLNEVRTGGNFTVPNGSVGIGTTSPQSKLQVNGGVQLANDTAAASASKVGTFKYYTSGNNSYVDMCMQTGATTYAWVNIVQNSW